MIIFICGIPASGKSSFGEFLRDKHGYFYIDMEHSPWADETIHSVWDLIFKELGNENRIGDFVKVLEAKGDKVVLDLGFVPNDAYFWIISSLRSFGCKVIWFNCPYDVARKRFVSRITSPPIELFEKQMNRISDNWKIIVDRINPEIVEIIREDGKSKTKNEIYTEVFMY